MLASWDKWGGFNTHLANTQRHVARIVRDMGGNREQRAFMERYDRSVPLAVQLVVMDVIAAGMFFAQPACDGEVKAFSATAAGTALVAEWGPSAADKVGTFAPVPPA